MAPVQERIMIDSARRMLRHGAYNKVANLLEGMRPGDAVGFFAMTTLDERRRLVTAMRREHLLRVLALLPAEAAAETFSGMDDAVIVGLLGQIPREDAAAALRDLDDERRDAILSQLDARTSGAVEELLAYPAGTVGAIMKPEAFALDEDASVAEAVQALQHGVGEGPIFYIYVTSKRGYLVGVVSYRMLLLARPDASLRGIMQTDVSSVRVDEPQEEAAALVSRHDLVAIPVVDADHRLLGVVTVDDIVDLIQAKATEDLFKMVGLESDDRVFCPPARSVRKRLPWLLVNLLTASLAATVVGLFQSTIQAAVILAVFMPIVAGMGGNAATQTLTVVIRGLAVGELSVRDAGRAMMKEATVNLTIGAVLGLLMAGVAFGFKGNPYLGLVLGAAMVTNMTVAGIAGAMVPLTLRAMRVDPALASGVLVTMFTDCCGFFSFLGMGTLLLQYIVQ